MNTLISLDIFFWILTYVSCIPNTNASLKVLKPLLIYLKISFILNPLSNSGIKLEISMLWCIPDHQQGIMKKRCKVYGVRYKEKGITLTVYGSRNT